MKNAIDNIKDGDEAMEYFNMCRHGITRTLHEVHYLLKDIELRTDDMPTLAALDKCKRLVEAQLDM